MKIVEIGTSLSMMRAMRTAVTRLVSAKIESKCITTVDNVMTTP